MRVHSALLVLVIAPSLLLAAGCTRSEARRAALCQRVAAALEDGAALTGALAPTRDGDAITLRYRIAGQAEPRRITCRFAPGDNTGDDANALVGVEADASGTLSAPRLAMLRIWLGLDATPPAPSDDHALPSAPRAPPLSPLGYFLQQLLNGLVLGAIYCLIAVGYAQVFSLLEIVNFAFGELFTIGAYLAIVVFVLLAGADTALGAAGATRALGPASAAFALLASLALVVPWGWAIERAVYRPLGIARATNAARLIPLVSAIGLSILLENLVRVSQGNRNKWLAPVIEGRLELPLGDGSALAIGLVQIVIVGAVAALCGALWWLLARTAFGRQQRACAQDRIAAALLGVDVERVISRTFMLGAGLAGAAGFAALLYYGQADPSMGYSVGFKALSAAVLGGIGSLAGSMIGGIVIGLAESLWSGYFDGAYRDVVIFAALIIVLVVRPSGLLGDPGKTSS